MMLHQRWHQPANRNPRLLCACHAATLGSKRRERAQKELRCYLWFDVGVSCRFVVPMLVVISHDIIEVSKIVVHDEGLFGYV